MISGLVFPRLAATAFVCGHYYLAQRLTSEPQWPDSVARMLLLIVHALAASIAQAPVVERTLSPLATGKAATATPPAS